MVVGEIVWKITGDDSGFKKANKRVKGGVKDTGKAIEKTTKKAEGMGTALKVGLAAAAAFAISKLKKFFSESVKAASDAQETAQKFGNVYNEITEKAIVAAKELASGYNVTITGAKEMLASTGNVLQAFGFSQDAALDYSVKLAQLGSDLTSFTNFQGGAVEATRILTKSLLGERDALQALDLKITEDQLKALARADGLVYKGLTQRQKAELTMKELYRQSNKAIGDVAKSANSYAFVQRRLDNSSQDLSESFGTKVLPGLTRLKSAFADNLETGGVFSGIMDGVGEAINRVFLALSSAIKILKHFKSLIASTKTEQEIATEVSGKYGAGVERVTRLAREQAFSLKDLQKQQKEASNSNNFQLARDLKAAIEVRKKKAILTEQENEDWKSVLKSAKETIDGVSKEESDAIKKSKKDNDKQSALQKKGTKDRKKELKKQIEDKNNFLNRIDNLGLSEFEKIEQQQQKELDKVQKFEDKKLITAKQAADARVKINKYASKKITEAYLQQANLFVSSVGGSIISLLGAIDSFYQAIADKDNERLEQQRNAALEAAGVAEEGTVQAAENALRIAQESGDESIIKEKEIELKRAKINDEFDKKKAELDYNANLRSWELQLSMAKIQLVQAPLSAYVSSLTAPWPLNMILPPINAALAAVTAGYGYAAVQQARPTKPKYEGGGFIGGNQRSGDLVDIRANAGESVLNPEQQKNFMDIANGAGRGNQTIMVHNIIELDGAVLYENMNEASRDGKLQIAEGSIIKT